MIKRKLTKKCNRITPMMIKEGKGGTNLKEDKYRERIKKVEIRRGERRYNK